MEIWLALHWRILLSNLIILLIFLEKIQVTVTVTVTEWHQETRRKWTEQLTLMARAAPSSLMASLRWPQKMSEIGPMIIWHTCVTIWNQRHTPASQSEIKDMHLRYNLKPGAHLPRDKYTYAQLQIHTRMRVTSYANGSFIKPAYSRLATWCWTWHVTLSRIQTGRSFCIS